MPGLKRLIEEVHRRSLWQVLAIYFAASWVVIEAADVIVARFSLPEWVYGAAIMLLLVGLPIVLATAFVQEGFGASSRHDPTLLPAEDRAPVRTQTTRARRLFTWRNAISGGLVAFGLWGVVATGLLLFSESHGDREEGVSGERKSVAVLPFANMSADPENEYFSDGITEEIITKLAQIQRLQVSSRTSVLRFKDAEEDIRDIATQLDVRYVLEGSVRKAGDQVRITAQLIDSETGFHLWAEDFQGSLDDIFDVQERTALQIAEALDLRLSPEEEHAVRQRYTENSAAFDAYLQGQALIRSWSDRDKLLAAREQFERALQLEPDYALALAGLASVEAQTYRNIDPSEDRLRRAERLAERAAELDPELVRAHIALGEIAAMRYDYVAAERKFREALAIDPEDAWAWDLLSWALGYQQPPQAVEAEKAAREAIVRQPDFANAYYHLGRALLFQERHQEAIEAFEHILGLDPNSSTAHFGLAQAYLATGEFVRAEEEAKASMRRGLTPIQTVILSYAYAAQGRTEEALAALEQALDLDYRDFAALGASPYLSELRQDQRFEELIARYRTGR